MLLRAIYQDEIVRHKLFNTLAYLLLYFVGLNILLPFVPAERVNYPMGQSLIDMIHAQPSLVHQTSILTLGANAYYMASVIVFLLIPFFDPVRAGKKQSIRKLIKVLTLLIASRQAFSYSQIVSYHFLGGDSSPYPFAVGLSWIVLVSGALFCMWIADRISDQGLLDGRILLICLALFSTFSDAILYEVADKLAVGQLLQLGMEIGLLLLITAGIVTLTQAIRYLPLSTQKGQTAQLENPTLRLRLNMVDEYPLYCAAQLIGFPMLLLQSEDFSGMDTPLARGLMTLADPTSPITLLLTFGVVALFTYGIARLIMRPKYYLAFLKQWNLELTNQPEEESAIVTFQVQFDQMAFLLAVASGVIGILPGIAILVFGVNFTLASFFGGYSLFLLVSLFTDFFSKLEQLALETGTIVGRSTKVDLSLVYELEEEWEE